MTSDAATDPPDRAIATASLANARRLLLAARVPAGHWEGELSSSALSTATALFALALHDRARHGSLVEAGIAWLLKTQNDDGGWGDTTKSFSNISTTALCWAALTVAGDDGAAAVAKAERWLTRAAGSLDPRALAGAVAARYGKDRTFSVPILTMCALADRLGDDPWRLIPQLPFELAAFPQSWFRFFRLPVVSYALPALISMGLARHRNRPSRNPLTRALRRLATNRVLGVLSQVQPRGGGFLEATPLTSFVTMSLIAAGRHDHPVVSRGVDFLVRSARPDGSWPIDTNLATWVTTLSINAIAAGGPTAVADALPPADRRVLREWLLDQQYKTTHPYTGAPPGAWAWTDLPGGVPDADDTAGALLALHHLGDLDDRTTRAAAAGVRWLLDLQNRDGGIPTFCRGWTNLPFDRSGPDLTAHALHAWSAWRDRLPADLAARVAAAEARAVRYLAAHQRPDGSWAPLWFGNQSAADEENPTYGTAKVLVALAARPDAATADLARRGAAWLLDAQHSDGGWGGGRGTPSSVEETGLALDALAATAQALPPSADWSPPIHQAIARGVEWLSGHTALGTRFPPAPIGFYFAKLWYFERDYPLLYALSGWARSRHALGGSERISLLSK